MRYNVKMRYYIYYYLKKKRENFDFDIIINNKYH